MNSVVVSLSVVPCDRGAPSKKGFKQLFYTVLLLIQQGFFFLGGGGKISCWQHWVSSSRTRKSTAPVMWPECCSFKVSSVCEDNLSFENIKGIINVYLWSLFAKNVIKHLHHFIYYRQAVQRARCLHSLYVHLWLSVQLWIMLLKYSDNSTMVGYISDGQKESSSALLLNANTAGDTVTSGGQVLCFLQMSAGLC